MQDIPAEQDEPGARHGATSRWRRPLSYAPALTLSLLIGPVAAGLAFTMAPAFGWLPALGGSNLTSAPFAALRDAPGLGASVRLSVVTGFGATLIALMVTLLILAGLHGRPAFQWIERLLSPLLSLPHAAAAFGLAFLVAPSGWLARLASPALTGWSRPPDLLIVNDPGGIALIAGLVAKEVPFLLLMSLAALRQTRAAQAMRTAQALGYGRVWAWFKVVLPALYPQIRLPVFTVLAYSMSVVDMAMILGPTTPPPLAVQVVDWMSDPDLGLRFQAAAGAVLQLGIVAGALLIWAGGERAIARAGRRWAEAGGRGRPLTDMLGSVAGLGLGALCAATLFAGLVALGLWSVAGSWAFPDALPASMSLRNWSRHGPQLAEAAGETAIIALAAAALAAALAVACLEAEHRHGVTPGSRSLWLLYLPLLVPQVAFLLGLQVVAIATGLGEGRTAVVLAHLVFVLPYVFLSLSGPWRAWDRRYDTVARALGAGPGRVLWAVRLPMLAAPLLTAFAVGFAVSVGQYLPTLLVGGGRVQTLTTEAVALAAGGDRRLIGAFALAQTAAVILPFVLALALPRLMYRNRGELSHG